MPLSFKVMAGRASPWPEHRPMYIDDEIDLLGLAFQLAGDGFHLVGHLWGVAIALKAALCHF